MKELALNELDLSEFIRAGDALIWGQACAEPVSLTACVAAQQVSLGGVTAFVGVNFANSFDPEQCTDIRFSSYGAIGHNRALVKAGLLDVMPLHFSSVESLIGSGEIACDVVLVQVSEPNAKGEYSLGLACDYMRAAVEQARVVIAEINPQVPHTYCIAPLTADDIDIAVRAEQGPVEVGAATITDLDRAIAEHALPLIPDGATLQMGIGAVPEALMAGLCDRRGLGLHSGMLGDAMIDLVEGGALTNEHKPIDRGISVGGTAIGSRRLFDFIDQNSSVQMHPVSHTHNHRVIASIPRFVAINSAIEVDLTGQVNAEVAGGRYVGAVGGQVDFVRGAMASEDGCSIIALPSTVKQGAVTRIVASLSGPVSTSRSDADVIVTEHGAARLRGKSLAQRVKAMLAITDPAHREELERQAHRVLKGLM